MFVKTVKLRLYIIFSVILVFGLYLDNSKFTLQFTVILFLLTFVFFIHGKRAGALSYAGVIYARSFFRYERDDRMIRVKIRSLDLLNYIRNAFTNASVSLKGSGISDFMSKTLYPIFK